MNQSNDGDENYFSFFNHSTSSAGNTIDNVTVDDGSEIDRGDLAVRVATGLGLYTLALVTCVGNGMVIQAIRTEKRLRKASNLFIMSLALADLVVGAFVMPISAVYVLTDRWYLGAWMCDAWLSIDYCASTASIFNLFVLSLDRYWSITSPLKYLRRRTKKRALLMTAAAWALSLLWILPVTGWHRMVHPDGRKRQTSPYTCDTEFADNIAFKVTTAVANFYVPTILMLYIYVRIFCTIRQRSRSGLGEVRAAASTPTPVTNAKIRPCRRHLPALAEAPDNGETTSIYTTDGSFEPGAMVQLSSGPRDQSNTLVWCHAKTGSGSRRAPSLQRSTAPTMSRKTTPNRNRLIDFYESLTMLELLGTDDDANGSTTHYPNVRISVQYVEEGAEPPANGGTAVSKLSSSSSSGTATSGNGHSHANQSAIISQKERKAARQLGVIMCAFIACWLPYFIVFLVVAMFPDSVNDTLFKVTLWLGYMNSTLNPVLYPLCNANFRRAFAKMFNTADCCRVACPLQRGAKQTHTTAAAGHPCGGNPNQPISHTRF